MKKCRPPGSDPEWAALRAALWKDKWTSRHASSLVIARLPFREFVGRIGQVVSQVIREDPLGF